MFVRCTRFSSRHLMTATHNPSRLPVLVQKDESGIATVTMQSPPVNIFNMELASSLAKTLGELEAKKTTSYILTSAYPSVFSSGLDLNLLNNPSSETFKLWWTQLQNIFLALYGSTAPTVAVISGYSAGFGCLLACSCEYRIMIQNEETKNDLIGYNEIQFGFDPPIWFILALKNILPTKIAERAALSGTLFSPQQALEIGLVDELASTKEEGVLKAKKWLQMFTQPYSDGRGVAKRSCRYEALEWMKVNRVRDVEECYKRVQSESYRKGVKNYFQSLKNCKN